MKAYSLDLRERILRAVDDGHSDRQAAQRFGVSPATVERYRRQRRESGSLGPKPIPGRPRAIPPEQHQALWAQLAAHPDATLAEHCQRWQAAHSVTVCFSTMARAIKRLGWTRKKDVGGHRTRHGSPRRMAGGDGRPRCPPLRLRR